MKLREDETLWPRAGWASGRLYEWSLRTSRVTCGPRIAASEMGESFVKKR